ncbi:flagellin C-terminal helical region [Selenomonas ruminantium]|uniref:Flagellin n=1 Tax=Selenomonas ruminantium TaxID=971 RepID=A0A1M6UN94_SELRU|nr:flagellin [Selenomonas ruminantium]SHK70636.1 flagellin C-terminal helical region [Selenomonas ruminantium]
MSMNIYSHVEGTKVRNQLNSNNSQLAKSLQKVSNGMKINSAGDDAAGYSISERMRTRIRGLYQCGDNTKAGHDMLNLASQAVDQQIQIMAHLREIALKASDDTYSQVDRDVLQSETNQMLMQINDISWDTNYNGIRLLDGVTDKVTTETKNVMTQGVFSSLGPSQANTTIGKLFPAGNTKSYYAGSMIAPSKYDPALVGYGGVGSGTWTATLDFSNSGGAVPTDFDNQGFAILCANCEQFISITFTTNLPVGEGMRYDEKNSDSCAYYIGIGGASTYDDIENAVYDGVLYANRNGSPRQQRYTRYPMRDNTILNKHDTIVSKDNNGNITISQKGNQPVFYEGTKGTVTPSPSSTVEEIAVHATYPYKGLYIQSDTPASQNTRYQLFNTTLDALFPANDSKFTLDPAKSDYPDDYSTDYNRFSTVTEKEQVWRDEEWPYPKKGAIASGTCVRTRENANKFLDDIDQALKYLLYVNTSLGAQINRLDNSNANIVTNTENTTAAESNIRDADMAKEMVIYTKSNVLQQAAQSMLAQSNQNLGTSLDLLK